MSDLAAMLADIDAQRRRFQAWLTEYQFTACDIPDCRHPCCRGKTVEQRKAEGRVTELNQEAEK